MAKNKNNIKGEDFEKKVELILFEGKIIFEKHKQMLGYGKRWVADFFIPTEKTVIECKNISKNNFIRCLQGDFIKFLDLRNRDSSLNFVFIVPNEMPTFDAFIRFCTKYDVKVTTPEEIINDLKKMTIVVNSRIGKGTPYERILKALEDFKDGATKVELSAKTGMCPPFVYHTLHQILKKNPEKIVSSVFSPRKYFTRDAYRNCSERLLIEELTTKPPETDYYLAEKYGFSEDEVCWLRRNKLKMKRKCNWKKKGNYNKKLIQSVGHYIGELPELYHYPIPIGGIIIEKNMGLQNFD